MNDAPQIAPPVRVSAWWLVSQAVWFALKLNVLAFVVLLPVGLWWFQAPLAQVVGMSLACGALWTAYFVAQTLLLFYFGVRNERMGAAVGISFGASIAILWGWVVSAPLDPQQIIGGIVGGFALGRINVRWLNRKIREAERRATERARANERFSVS